MCCWPPGPAGTTGDIGAFPVENCVVSCTACTDSLMALEVLSVGPLLLLTPTQCACRASVVALLVLVVCPFAGPTGGYLFG